MQKFLMATSLFKDSIQDSLNMTVSDDGKLNDTAVRRQLDTKFPSVMCKTIPIDAIFKDQAKFDNQNPIISSLLTQFVKNKKRKKLKTIGDCIFREGFNNCRAFATIESI